MNKNLAYRDVILLVFRALGDEEMHRIQVVCKTWYARHIPLAMGKVHLPFEDIKRLVADMLTSVPQDAKVEPFNVQSVHAYWRTFQPRTPLFDFKHAEYDEWCSSTGLYRGMRHKSSGRPHGIVKVRRASGGVLEGAYNDGTRFGLFRWTFENIVSVELYDYDRCVASVQFDASRIETGRKDPEILLRSSFLDTSASSIGAA